MPKFSREKAIETGYGLADFIGDLSLAYGPVAIFIIQAMATTSIALNASLATNHVFTLGWAIATAIIVDALWLGTWLRVRSFKLEKQATPLHTTAMVMRYGAMLFLALFMTLVAIAMAILITYQQVYEVSNDQVAMRALYIDPLWFVIARGVLVIVCATVAIFFRAEKAEAIAQKKRTTATQSKPQAKVSVSEEKQTLALPSPATANHSAMLGEERSAQYIAIKEAMATAAIDGKLTMTLQTIALNAGVGYSTVRKHAGDIKKELGIE